MQHRGHPCKCLPLLIMRILADRRPARKKCRVQDTKSYSKIDACSRVCGVGDIDALKVLLAEFASFLPSSAETHSLGRSGPLDEIKTKRRLSTSLLKFVAPPESLSLPRFEKEKNVPSNGKLNFSLSEINLPSTPPFRYGCGID